MKLVQINSNLPRWPMPVVVIALLVAYNISALSIHGLARWLEMLVVLVVIGYVCYLYDVTFKELGMLRSDVRSGMRWGLWCVAAITAVLATVYIVHPQAFIDSRYHEGWPKALLTMFLLIPLQTVLLEEFFFRGVLFASLRRQFIDRWAVLITAIIFGLWHIVPSLHIVTSSEALGQAGAHTANPQLSAIIVSVVATTFAGAFLCWLRLRSHSLVAPILAHWAINAVSVAFVVLAYARLN